MHTARASITAIRAISAHLAWRFLQPMILGGTVLAITLITFGGWLTTQNALWWILEFVFITSTMFFVILTCIVIAILKRFTPIQNKVQKQAVKVFVDKLQRVADAIGISRFVLLFRIVRDIVRPNDTAFVKQIANDSTTLHTDYLKLQKLFESNT